jgi:hypothetical protein
MKAIILPAGAGKTDRLIQESAKSGGYIVVKTMDECSNVQSRARDMGLSIPFPLTYRELDNGDYHAPGIKSFLIDNVDRYFEWLTRVPVSFITLRKEFVEE